MTQNTFNWLTLVRVITVLRRQQAITWGDAHPDQCRHFELTINDWYPALTGELWGVYCGFSGNVTALYRERIFLHTTEWIPSDKGSMFTSSECKLLHQFVHARTIGEDDVAMPLFRPRVTSQYWIRIGRPGNSEGMDKGCLFSSNLCVQEMNCVWLTINNTFFGHSWNDSLMVSSQPHPTKSSIRIQGHSLNPNGSICFQPSIFPLQDCLPSWWRHQMETFSA